MTIWTPALSRICLPGWWFDLRASWYRLDKTPLIAFGVLGVVLAGLGTLAMRVAAERDAARNLECLALNVFHEARGEPLKGQYAVAEVTMNRVSSGRYAGTVCAVVYQKNWDPLRKRYVGAFSWTELPAPALPYGAEWRRARDIADAVYHRRAEPILRDALHYHATHVRPSWAVGRRPLARIGRHVFYR